MKILFLLLITVKTVSAGINCYSPNQNGPNLRFNIWPEDLTHQMPVSHKITGFAYLSEDNYPTIEANIDEGYVSFRNTRLGLIHSYSIKGIFHHGRLPEKFNFKIDNIDSVLNGTQVDKFTGSVKLETPYDKREFSMVCSVFGEI